MTLYIAWPERGVFEVKVKLCLFRGVVGLVILASTISGLYGNMPVAVNADLIFNFVKAASHAGRNIVQNSHLFMETNPKLLCIRS